MGIKMRLSLVFILLLFAHTASASIGQVEAYLTSLQTMTADFEQISPDGTRSSGKFFLKRPKKMRWQYNPPTPVLMVTRGDYLTYYDYELGQVSDVPIELLSILSDQRVNFAASGIVVTEHYAQNGYITVTLQRQDKPEEGALSLIIRQYPMVLSHFIFTDATGQVTQTSLSNMVTNMALEDAVFDFKDPRIGGTNKKYDRLQP